MLKKHLHKVKLCDMWTAGYQTRSLFFSATGKRYSPGHRRTSRRILA